MGLSDTKVGHLVGKERSTSHNTVGRKQDSASQQEKTGGTHVEDGITLTVQAGKISGGECSTGRLQIFSPHFGGGQ